MGQQVLVIGEFHAQLGRDLGFLGHALQPLLQNMTPGKWHTVALALHCDDARSKPQSAAEAVRFSTDQQFSLAVADIALVNTVTPSALLLGCGQ